MTPTARHSCKPDDYPVPGAREWSNYIDNVATNILNGDMSILGLWIRFLCTYLHSNIYVCDILNEANTCSVLVITQSDLFGGW